MSPGVGGSPRAAAAGVGVTEAGVVELMLLRLQCLFDWAAMHGIEPNFGLSSCPHNDFVIWDKLAVDELMYGPGFRRPMELH